MKRGRLLKSVLCLTAACIILPAVVLLIWCFAARWPWPGMLPESLSLRTVKELIFGSAKLPKLLLSSISLSFAVAAISTTIGIATARATELYEFRGKGLIRFFSLLPLLVPGTVLAIGAQNAAEGGPRGQHSGDHTDTHRGFRTILHNHNDRRYGGTGR